MIKETGKKLLVDFKFDSVIIRDEELIKGSKRLLETDNSLVLPYNSIIRFLIPHQMYFMPGRYQSWV